MLNKRDNTVALLATLGMKRDEARIYLELLRGPNTHLRLAQATGINRTKVYRIVADLEKRSLVAHRTDDRGTFLVANDPAVLEMAVSAQEEKVAQQRTAFSQLKTALPEIQIGGSTHFVVNTYDGEEGFKQMLWHELSARGETLIFGSGTIEDLVPNKLWAEKLRAHTVAAGYKIRELLNPGEKKPAFTLNGQFKDAYQARILPRQTLLLKNQIVIYNNTVATYHWRDEQKVGVEITNDAHTHFMRQMFEHYWRQTTTAFLPK